MKAPLHSPDLRQPARGFTLVELLVVIVIIVTLAALSMVGFRRLRVSANKVTASRNIAQLQIANTSYAADHNGTYMPVWSSDSGGNKIPWFEDATVLSYIVGEDGIIKGPGDVLMVPLNMLDPVVVREKMLGYDMYPASFGYNNTTKEANDLPNPGASLKRLTSNIGSPERSMAFITATDWQAKYSGRYLWKNRPVEGRTEDGKIAFRHGGKALAVYFDGHVGEVTMADFNKIDANGGNKHPFWLPTQ